MFTTTEKKPILLPSLDTMVSLYAQSMKVCLQSEHLLSRTEELRRLVLNSEIVATRAGEQSRIFGVISKEVSILTVKITEMIEKLFEAAGKLAGLAIAGAGKSRFCEKYLLAWKSGMTRNAELVLKAREDRGSELLSDLERLGTQLKVAENTIHDLSRLSVHIPVVSILFKIESANSKTNVGTLFHDIAKRLLTLNEGLLTDIEQLQKDAGVALATFENVYGKEKTDA